MWLRSLAAILGAVAAALYTWGLLHVAGAVIDAEDGGADSSPLRPCRTPGQWERALHVVDYTVDYVPLRFVCETKGGGSYAAESVPGYVNPGVLGSVLAAAGCAGAAALDSKRRAGGAGPCDAGGPRPPARLGAQLPPAPLSKCCPFSQSHPRQAIRAERTYGRAVDAAPGCGAPPSAR